MEETAEFIKQIINNGKSDTQKELMKMAQEVDRVRRDMVDKCSVNEMLEMKNKIMGDIEVKVELKEVQ